MAFLLWMWAAAEAATLAILPFDNLSGDPEHDPLGTGVSVMLLSDLSAVGSLRLVERARLNDLIAELELQRSDLVDPKTAAKAGKIVGADWILTGALQAVEPDLRLDARIVDVQSGTILGTGTARGPVTSFFEVEKDLALVITDKLGLALSSREAAKVGRVATESFDAFRAWSEGLEAIDRGAVDEARKRFSAALRFDSGFSAANAALDSIRASLDRSEAVREKVFDEDLDWFQGFTEDHAKGKADVASLQAKLQQVRSQLATRPPAVQQAVARLLIDLELPESVSIYPQGGGSVNEFALQLMVMSSATQKDREGVLSWGQAYVERYPNGPTYAAVRAQLDMVLALVDKERRARSTGVIERIAAQHGFEQAMTRCENAIVPKQRAQACREMLGAAKGAAEVDWKDVFEEAMEGASDAGDVGLAEVALAAVRERWTSPAAVRGAEEEVAELKACLAGLDAAEAKLDEVIERGTTRYYARHLDPFERCGAYARAFTLAARIPDAKQRDKVRWEMLVAQGRVDELKPLHQSVMHETDPFVPESRRTIDIENLERQAAMVRGAEAMRLWGMASALQSEGLNRDAAELLDELVDEHLDAAVYVEPALIVQQAGSLWYGVFEADAPAKARAYFQRVLDDYPDSDQANTARTMLRFVR